VENRDEEYEQSVLNFLDHEIAELQLRKIPESRESQFDELDSLVNSLLEQVRTESDF
jgi:hypothetical protein